MPRYIKFCSVEIDPVSELSPKELQTWTPKFYVLYKTPMSDGVSLEAFMITSNHELIILQLTAAKEHAVEIRGLKALLNRFKNSYNSSCIEKITGQILSLCDMMKNLNYVDVSVEFHTRAALGPVTGRLHLNSFC